MFTLLILKNSIQVSHEVEIQSDSDVANYEDSTSISPTQSTSSSSESLQEYNCDVVVGHDCQLEGDAIEEGDGNGQGRVSDEICNSKRLGQRQDSTPEEMPITEQPREMHSTTFEDSTLPKEDDIANSDGTTISATQRTVESEPWSRSDMESSEDNVPPTALTHSQGNVYFQYQLDVITRSELAARKHINTVFLQSSFILR